MTAFDTALAVFFTDPNLSRPAVYTPPGGEPIACSVIVMEPDVLLEPYGETRLVAPDRVIDVRAADLKPVFGGQFAIAGTVYEITQEPFVPENDPVRLTYRAPVRAV